MKDYQGSALLKKALQAVIGLCLAGMLASCGGGGGGGECTPTEFGKPCDQTASTPPKTDDGEATVKSDGIAVGVNFLSTAPADKSIVIKGSGGNGRTEVAILKFKVVDKAGVGVANKTVNFRTAQPVTLGSGSAVTESDGSVAVSVISGSVPTPVVITATTVGPNGAIISTPSDTLTVTTGQPAQGSFDISATKHFVEGWHYSNSTTDIIVLLADVKGQVVADGTPVVFETDSGAIFNPDSGDARCLTIKGECKVRWRSQEPRLIGGRVMIVATAANGGSTPLTAHIELVNSGSFATTITGTPLIPLGSPNAGAFSLEGKCEAQTLYINLKDLNNNPLPEGTKISIENPVGVSASISTAESEVRYVRSITGIPAGTDHAISVSPPGNCVESGGSSKTGSFNIVVKTPFGNYSGASVKVVDFQTP